MTVPLPRMRRHGGLIGALAWISALTASGACAADESLLKVFTQGRPDLFLRYRFEFVDDGAPNLKNAYASTLRTALGFNSGDFYRLGFYVQMEDVRIVGDDLFNDGSNRIADRALVVDPEGVELQQGYLRYSGVPKTVVSVGRQEITHREAPMHRFVGNILWRQNWQSFDAVRVNSLALPKTIIDYAYVWNANRIFGEDNPLPDASDFALNAHFINLLYSGLAFGKLEAYAYLLDFDTATASRFSTVTYGGRLDGNYDPAPTWRVNYTLELANQLGYADNPNDVNVNYYLAELGGSYKLGSALESLSLKFSFEMLEGDGGQKAFQTPLGTNHAFQGWADRFLVTPGDGILDYHVTLDAKILGAQLTAVYHRFVSDRDAYDYGDEWDVQLEKSIAKRFLLGLKYANYQADRNALNVARNTVSGQDFDRENVWAYVQFKY
jgi:hypothetical protein